MKVIAFYLPQFHEIPENNKWWGNGFTEWTTLKKAKPLFENHYQPRIPLNNNYYDLSDVIKMEWQCKLAKKYGVYGFCMYHYWFDGHMLLQKPMEQYLLDENCDLPFCICWANENWTKAWESKENTILITQKYGNKKQWKEHFEYLLPFFKDKRYIKENNKPFFVIYRPQIIECLDEMLAFWDELAKQNGLNGMVYAFQHPSYCHIDMTNKNSNFKYAIEYQPGYARLLSQTKMFTFLQQVKQKINLFTEKKLGFTIDVSKYRRHTLPLMYDYDKEWEKILTSIPNNKSLPGAFTDWDNTPRRGNKGFLYTGVTVEKFKENFKTLVIRTKTIYKKDMIFIFAWNEWTEGGYLEPDEKNGYGFLKGIKSALLETNEMPNGYGEVNCK